MSNDKSLSVALTDIKLVAFALSKEHPKESDKLSDSLFKVWEHLKKLDRARGSLEILLDMMEHTKEMTAEADVSSQQIETALHKLLGWADEVCELITLLNLHNKY